MTLTEWAIKHHVSLAALADLRALLATPVPPSGADGSEARVASAIRLEAGKRGDVVLWRNNVGAFENKQGQWVRFGLANESKAMSERIKSADLIGIHRRLIGPEDVGRVIGQFLSVETKREGWRPGNSQRDEAQAAWGAGVAAWGGVSLIHASASLPAFDSLPLGVFGHGA